MSTTAVVPPPSSASVMRRVPQLTARARALVTEMNLHFAGVAVLVLLDLYLMLHLIFVWQGLSSRDASALDQQRVELRAAEVAARPLRGLDAKLEASTKAADAFTADRLPYADSQVATELGAVSRRAGVHLTRVQYSYEPVLANGAAPGDALTEVRMDASVSGDYRPVVQFINSLERDKLFFVITGINFTGQQTGQVNLRVRVTTYLRAPHNGEANADLPGTTDATSDGTNLAGGQP